MMFSGGVATINVRELDSAIAFYTETLGLKLIRKYGPEFAEIDVGNGFRIGLHPITNSMDGVMPAGVNGSISIGLVAKVPLEEIIEKLKSKNVKFTSDIFDDPRTPIRLTFLTDPDGNSLYIEQWRQLKS